MFTITDILFLFLKRIDILIKHDNFSVFNAEFNLQMQQNSD